MNKQPVCMSGRYLAGAFLLLFIACQTSPGKSKDRNDMTEVFFTTETIQLDDNQTPAVNIEKYTLVCAPQENRKKDAAAILKLKRKWPLAMQSQNPAAFDSILGKNFTFAGDGHLLNRAEYIKDRTSPSDWRITDVQYDNLTLQFFGDIAILSYRNRVKNENSRGAPAETEWMSWVDIYTKENGGWKIGASHTVDYRVEK